MEPITLASNQPSARFYQGGSRISSFRNEAPAPPNTPEDWIGSTTSVRGQAPVGMTRLANGELLADAIARDPESWLGVAHVERFGVDSKLLVKLLDAGQRLPVHAHPDAEFAGRHVSAAHGKAEAWYILLPGIVYVGLKRDVPSTELRALVAEQDTVSLVSLMHAVEVNAGDSVFVPPGVLHAIGEGILLAEVQEPEDLSILLEWKGFDLDGATDGHLGLGFDLALTALELRGRSLAEVEQLIVRRGNAGPALAGAAETFFRLDLVQGHGDFAAGLSVVIALEPSSLSLASGATRALPSGSTTLIAHRVGAFSLDGGALVARPPAP